MYILFLFLIDYFYLKNQSSFVNDITFCIYIYSGLVLVCDLYGTIKVLGRFAPPFSTITIIV